MAERKLCACDCGEPVASRRREWIPGHDGKMYGDIIDAVDGLVVLKRVVEQHLGKPVPRVRRPAPKSV